MRRPLLQEQFGSPLTSVISGNLFTAVIKTIAWCHCHCQPLPLEKCQTLTNALVYYFDMVLINGETDSFTDMHKASERVDERERESFRE